MGALKLNFLPTEKYNGISRLVQESLYGNTLDSLLNHYHVIKNYTYKCRYKQHLIQRNFNDMQIIMRRVDEPIILKEYTM